MPTAVISRVKLKEANERINDFNKLQKTVESWQFDVLLQEELGLD